MNKLLVICGPTATGKTSLGISLAKKFGGEVVSADSRQVYRGMDVGTGKDLPVNSELRIMNDELGIKNEKYAIGYYLFDSIPVWLLDLVEPDYRFSVADYVRCASLVIRDIWKRGRLPIIVGGTGFYIKGLIDGIESLGVEPDWELRKQLDSLTAGQLGSYLEKIDPQKWEAMNESDRRNPRRLMRGIEIAKKIQNSKLKVKNYNPKLKIKDLLMVGLTAINEKLYERIDKRVEKRVGQGAENEIKNLLERGYNWENSVLGTTLGYRKWRDYFEKKASRKEVIQKWKYNEHSYARRQKTWFKQEDRLLWFDIGREGWKDKVEKLVKRWYTACSYAEKN